jgi:heat shock protein HslJ
MRHRLLGVAIVGMLLLGACSGGGAGSASLEGRTFLSVAVDGRALVPGTRIELRFDRGSIGASAGCNSMGAEYRMDGNLLVVGQMSQTEMGCDPGRMAQDQWLAELLTGRPQASLAGDTLTLEAAGIRVTLRDREVVNPDRPLVGTRWILDGLISGDAVSSVPAPASMTITDGRASVEPGCNQGGADVEIGDGEMAFGPMALTKMACEPDRMALEQAVTSVLSGRVTWSIEADVLTVLAPNGQGLVFRAGS